MFDRAGARRGVVVNIASVAGITMMKGLAHYAVSKAGVATLTRSLAKPPFLFMTGSVVLIDGGLTLGK